VKVDAEDGDRDLSGIAPRAVVSLIRMRASGGVKVDQHDEFAAAKQLSDVIALDQRSMIASRHYCGIAPHAVTWRQPVLGRQPLYALGAPGGLRRWFSHALGVSPLLQEGIV
jgi:hypothetical protein